MKDSSKNNKYQNTIIRFDNLYISKDSRFLIIKIGTNTILIKNETILRMLDEKREQKEGA